jgi:RNA polymerase-binding transcription factor DksA
MTTNTHIKEQLLAQHAQIIIDLEQIAVFDESTGDWEAVPIASELLEADENNEADAAEEWEGRHATVTALETSFRMIERALQNIETGTYGICEVCQTPIESDRLAILLTARTCKTHMDDERTLSL